MAAWGYGGMGVWRYGGMRVWRYGGGGGGGMVIYMGTFGKVHSCCRAHSSPV